MILVGERLATSPGALTAAADAGRHAPAPGSPGCRAVPATAAPSRPAACPTCCPVAARSPTPPPASTLATAWGVDAPARDRRAATPTRSSPRLVAGELGGLVVGGVDPDDTADPAADPRRARRPRRSWSRLELRETDVTRAADVVFPVAPAVDKAGTFVDLGGPAAALRRGLRQPARRCPTCGCSPASPRSSAARSASAPSPRSRAQMEELGPVGRRARRPRRAVATAPRDRRRPKRGRPARWRPGSSCSTTARCRTATSTCAPPPATPVARVSPRGRTTPRGADRHRHRRPRLGHPAGRGRRPRRRRGLGAGQLAPATACSPTWPRPAAGSP